MELRLDCGGGVKLTLEFSQDIPVEEFLKQASRVEAMVRRGPGRTSPGAPHKAPDPANPLPYSEDELVQDFQSHFDRHKLTHNRQSMDHDQRLQVLEEHMDKVIAFLDYISS